LCLPPRIFHSATLSEAIEPVKKCPLESLGISFRFDAERAFLHKLSGGARELGVEQVSHGGGVAGLAEGSVQISAGAIGGNVEGAVADRTRIVPSGVRCPAP
jgi:hypothetical protein